MSNYFKKYPNSEGFFEEYGGAFIPPALEVEMKKITDAYHTISKSHNFIQELRSIRKHYQDAQLRYIIVHVCQKNMEVVFI